MKYLYFVLCSLLGAQIGLSAPKGTLNISFFAEGSTAPSVEFSVENQGSYLSDQNGQVIKELPAGTHKVLLQYENIAASQEFKIAEGLVTIVTVNLQPGFAPRFSVENPEVRQLQWQRTRNWDPQRPCRDVSWSLTDKSPIANAQIYVRGLRVQERSDEDGNYSISVPAGVHGISIIHPKFSTLNAENFEVPEGGQELFHTIPSRN